MIRVLSYLIAVIFTIIFVVILYPIAGVFWVLGLFGKLADGIFALTKNIISYLWKDISKFKDQTVNSSANGNGVNKSNNDNYNEVIIETTIANTAGDTWVCHCGNANSSNFCSTCGTPRPIENAE